MDPQILARLLSAYRATAERAKFEFKCLSEGGNADDVLAVDTEEESDGLTVRVQGPMDGFFGVSARDIIAELDDKKPKSIKLLIESPGGFVSEGLALYADLRARAEEGVKIAAESRGVVASAAVLPFLAADERSMGDGAMLMVHRPWGFLFAVGDYEDLKKESSAIENGLKAHTTNYAEILAKRTGMPKKDAEKAMADETWYAAEDAIEAGYAAALKEPQISEADRQLAAQAMQRAAAASMIVDRYKPTT